MQNKLGPLLKVLVLLALTDPSAQAAEIGDCSKAMTSTHESRQQRTLAIIVNKSNPIENVSFAELRRIFRAERSRWQNGRRVTLVMRDLGQMEREFVLQSIYQMDDSDFRRYFLQAQFTGEVSSEPKVLSTARGVQKFVFNVPSAVGYVFVEDIDDTVKPLLIDGHAPCDAGYRLTKLVR